MEAFFDFRNISPVAPYYNWYVGCIFRSEHYMGLNAMCNVLFLCTLCTYLVLSYVGKQMSTSLSARMSHTHMPCMCSVLFIAVYFVCVCMLKCVSGEQKTHTCCVASSLDKRKGGMFANIRRVCIIFYTCTIGHLYYVCRSYL